MWRRSATSLKSRVQLVPVLAVWPVGVRCVGGTSGEEWFEGFFDEARAVLERLPDLVHAEDAVVVEAGAVVDCPLGSPEVEEASAERVVVHGVAVVAEIELGDVSVSQ